jgi:hypothetical protein
MRTTLLALTLALISTAHAHTQSAFGFATFPPSPAANGRGGIFLGPEDADPYAAWSNPGLLGLIAKTQHASASFYPKRTLWLPGWETESFRMDYSVRALFFSLADNSCSANCQRLPVGFSYNEQHFSYGELSIYNSQGEVVGTSSDEYEVARGFHVGTASQNRFWRFGGGLGFTHLYGHYPRVEESEIKYRNYAGFGLDAGLWLDNDAVESASTLLKISIPRSLVVRPSVGCSVANLGQSVKYEGGSYDSPLPRTARVSMGLSAAYEIDLRDGLPWRVGAIDVMSTAEDELIQPNGDNDYSYEFPPGDINPFRDVLFGQRNDQLIQRHGFQLSALEIVTWSTGSFQFDSRQSYTVKTEGWGLSLHGLVRLTVTKSMGKHLNWFAQHMDVRYYESVESVKPRSDLWYDSHPRDGTTYKGVVISYLR